MAASKARELPASWIAPVSRALADPNGDVTAAAVAVARAVPPSKEASASMNEALMRVAHDANRPKEVRLDALAAVSGGLSSVERRSVRVGVRISGAGDPRHDSSGRGNRARERDP